MTTMTTEYANHPCFGMTSRKTIGRLHLPVAPRVNAKIKFAGGSKPAVKPQSAVTPDEAVAWMERTLEGEKNIGIIGITGPGDPLAVPDPTLRSLRMVRDRLPEMDLCLTTLGLGLEHHAPELAAIGVSHVTLLVDAVSPVVAEKLYAWIRPGRKTVPLAEAAGILIEEQAKAVTALKKVGITVKVNSTVYPGYNASHIEEIAATMADLGADIMAVVPFWPSDEDSEFPVRPDMELLATVRDRAARHIHLMPAWEECDEALVGLTDGGGDSATPSMILPKPTRDRPNVAVVTSSGMDVDLHLGHAHKVMIFGPREDGLNCLLDTRDAPEPGSGASRWEQLADILSDCFVLLAASAGQSPKEILSRKGLAVIVTDGEIEGTVDVLYGGGKKGKKRKQ